MCQAQFQALGTVNISVNETKIPPLVNLHYDERRQRTVNKQRTQSVLEGGKYY